MEEREGRFVWYDLMTPDAAMARDFYPAVTGWSVAPWSEGPEGSDEYWMWSVGDQPIGGLVELPSEMEVPPNWLAYLSVDDVDRKVARAEELGATLAHGPEEIPAVGRFAVIQDPQGAAVALFESERESRPMGPPEPGRMWWHELGTTDHQAAWDFYAALFGWERSSSFDMGDGAMYEMFSIDGREVGAMYDKTAEMPGPPGWLYYVHVPDLDASLEAVGSAGGKVLAGPMEVPGGDRIAVCTDPAGAVFALHSSD